MTSVRRVSCRLSECHWCGCRARWPPSVADNVYTAPPALVGSRRSCRHFGNSGKGKSKDKTQETHYTEPLPPTLQARFPFPFCLSKCVPPPFFGICSRSSHGSPPIIKPQPWMRVRAFFDGGAEDV